MSQITAELALSEAIDRALNQGVDPGRVIQIFTDTLSFNGFPVTGRFEVGPIEGGVLLRWGVLSGIITCDEARGYAAVLQEVAEVSETCGLVGSYFGAFKDKELGDKLLKDLLPRLRKWGENRVKAVEETTNGRI